MRVLVAPDKFTGSMSASTAAQAITAGWRSTAAADDLIEAPLSDGGPGFLDTLQAARGGQREDVAAIGPWGHPVVAQILWIEDAGVLTACIESAQTLGDVPLERGSAGSASSQGLGMVLRHAVAEGATRIVIGLGGSLTSDGGAGMLANLGVTARDTAGADATEVLKGGGAGLYQVQMVDLEPARELLAGRDVIVAADVDIPLLGPRGAARGFAAQKGADPELVEDLERSLKALAHACARLPDGRSPAVALGAGAAGGLGFALMHVGGRIVVGIEWLLQTINFSSEVCRADLVVTGEGRFDWQSLQGKVITGVCATALAEGRPVLVLAGQVAIGRREWMAIGVSGCYAIIEGTHGEATPQEVAQAQAEGPDRLAQIAARAARTWSR